MEIEKPKIKTYSRRQPITRYESSAVLVPSYVRPSQVRESRLNDKTLIVEDFDDTFDRLATGVVIPSPENSLDQNGVVRRKDTDIFDFFKVPLQAKKKDKSKPKGKSKRKDPISKSTSVKRKKVDVDSDDSSLSDQEENHKKQTVGKKSKEKVKKVVKKKKELPLVKGAKNNEQVVRESVDENVPNNIEKSKKESMESNDNVKKPNKDSDKNQHNNIQQYFIASTPRVGRIQSKIDMQNLSPVVMEKNIEKGKQLELNTIAEEMQAENASENVECTQNNGTITTDNIPKLRESTKVHLLRDSDNLLTSTPRINKMRMPVDLDNLSLIISDTQRHVSDDVNENTAAVDVNAENDRNSEAESNPGDDVQEPSEKVEESIKPLMEPDETQHSSVKEIEEQIVKEKTCEDQPNLLVSSIATEKDGEDIRENGVDLSESAVDDENDSLLPAVNIQDKQQSTNNCVVENDLIRDTPSFSPSPLMFEDSEFVQDEKDESNAVQEVNEEHVQINFSQDISERVEENNTESANVKPPISKNKNFEESSFYPDDWTNDYDSTYGYDQLKNGLQKNETVDSMLDEGENENSINGSEKADNTVAENVSEFNDVSNADNTDIQSVENGEQEKTEHTICDEDRTIEGDKDESDKQEEQSNASSTHNEDEVSENEGQDDSQDSQIAIEENQSHPEDENLSLLVDQDDDVTKDDDSDDQSITESIRPSKRRKTDASEIAVYDKVEDDLASLQNEEENLDESDESIGEPVSAPEDANDENTDTESTGKIILEKSVQYEEITKKLPDREIRVILSRINLKDYKSPILSRKKTVKRKSVKRLSRKSRSVDDDDFIPSTKIEKRASKTSVSRLTRGSITEDKMKHLYVQYQCKDVIIFAVRLEDQKIDVPLRRSLKRKSSIDEDNEVDDDSLTNGALSEFLAKLNDPRRTTMRRKTQKKHDRLAAINEDQVGQNSEDKVGKKIVTWGNDKRVTFNDSGKNSEDIEDNDQRKSQPIFLKPGKSWARSLSIINHFHNGKNLDELAAGRENWRHSVQTVLNMQPEASSRTSSQNYEETERESRVSRASSQRDSKSVRKSSNASNSRFSMRIIPSGKRSTLTDDLMDSQRISYVSDRSRASRKTSLKIRRDTLIETEDDLIRSAKDIILKRCKQTDYEPFDVCFPDSYIDNCRKIGEGVYGEVFLYENGSEKSVIKIIPIEGDQLVNCEPQKKFHEILSEIIIAEELHKLRYDGEFQTNGFVEVNRIMCVIGKYPEKLIDLWYAYDEQKKSENDCPSMFEDDQLYIILELAHGGQDLEAYTFQNASESYAVFSQTALTLAVAEQSLEFEHRDLHWGNLLISKTEDKHSTYKLGNEEISLPTKSVKVTVIDFTLSRMSYQGCKIFNDLAADPTLFEAQGEYQFDIYRMMRDNVNDDWQQFNPFTNILWMDYVLDKMITAARYKKKTTKIHKSAIDDMKSLRKEIMKYSSAFDFVTNCKKVQALFDST